MFVEHRFFLFKIPNIFDIKLEICSAVVFSSILQNYTNLFRTIINLKKIKVRSIHLRVIYLFMLCMYM